MVGLPPGWEADHDARRWFYTYKPTGHAQYSFPGEGDEFPHFVDAPAPAPDLDPEERRESEQQICRQSHGDGPKARDSAPEPAGELRMSATAARPVSNVWEADFKMAHELPVDVSLPTTFDPVGIVAEMPTEHTPVSRIEMHPEPAELGDNSILAPIETAAYASLEQQQQQDFQQSSSEAGRPPFYQPWTPDPDSTYLRPDKRKSKGAFFQRDVSLMLSLKLPGNLEPSTVPRILSPPQMPPKVLMQQHEVPRQDALQAEDAPLAPEPSERDGRRIPLQQLAQPTAASDSRSSSRPGHEKTQSQGALSKIPSVLKPARGRIAVTHQQQSLSAPKRSSAPSPVSWKTTWEATPPPPVTALPTYVPYQKGPDDQAPPQPQRTWQAEEPFRQPGAGVTNPSLQPSAPSTPPPPPPRQGPDSMQRQPGLAGTASPERGLRRASPRSLADVSPMQSRSESLSSRHPIRTPSPVEPILRGSSNQGANEATHSSSLSVHQAPGSASRMVPQDRVQGNRGPTVPDKIPLEHVDESYFPAQAPALGRGGQSQRPPLEKTVSSPLRYPSDEYPVGSQVKTSPAQRHAASSASQSSVPGAQQPNHSMPQSPPQDSAASTPDSKLGRIEEDGERGAVAKPKIVAQNAVPISVASSTQPSPPARISCLQAHTFSVLAGPHLPCAGAPAQGDANQQTAGQSGSPPREQHRPQSNRRVPSDGTSSSQGTPSIRLVQSRDESRDGAHASESGTFGQPLQSHPLGKTPVPTAGPLQEFPTASALGSGANKLPATDKEKKWTKWFKSPRLSRSQKEQAHFGSMMGPGNATQLPT